MREKGGKAKRREERESNRKESEEQKRERELLLIFLLSDTDRDKADYNSTRCARALTLYLNRILFDRSVSVSSSSSLTLCISLGDLFSLSLL